MIPARPHAPAPPRPPNMNDPGLVWAIMVIITFALGVTGCLFSAYDIRTSAPERPQAVELRATVRQGP